MKFFLDTADVDEIRDWSQTGLLDGVTTNPSLILKSGRDIKEVLAEICDLVDGDVSGEVAATDYESMLKEGRELAKIADNICIKLPITMDGLRACKTLVDEGFKTNMTLCFNANQALLVAKAGGTYVSPFIGRLDDMGIDGLELIEEIRHHFCQRQLINDCRSFVEDVKKTSWCRLKVQGYSFMPFFKPLCGRVFRRITHLRVN